MEIRIKYQDIVDKCEKLSSFEADGKHDANGESRYLDIHINEGDKTLIEDYIMQAVGIIGEKFGRMILDVANTYTKKYEWVTVEETRPFYPFKQIVTGSNQAEFEKALSDALPPTYATFSDIYFLESFGIFVIYSPNTELYYSHPSAVGHYYIKDLDNVKLYEDENKNKYQWETRGLVEYKPKRELVPVYDNKGFTWILRDDTRWNGANAFTKHVEEAIASYTMAQWLSGRLDERVQFYEALFTTSLAMATKNLFTKQAPV